MREASIHTNDEITEEVERLRAELPSLLAAGIVHPFFIEEDLKTEAYNRLTEKKFKGSTT